MPATSTGVGAASVPATIDRGERGEGGSAGGPPASTSAAAPLKRSAADAFDDSSSDDEDADADGGRDKKKLRGDGAAEAEADGSGAGGAVDGGALADHLEEELQCGCCSAIVYRPVVVAPCQHFFCGRCVGPPCLCESGAEVLPLGICVCAVA